MSFTNFIQLQRDAAHLLLGDSWLQYINVVTREEILETGSTLPDETLAYETLAYTTERNGRRGCGVIVEKPEMAATHPNVPGPQGQIMLTFLVLENPLENEAIDIGTQIPADQVGQRILDLAHLWAVEGVGMFRADAAAMVAARDFEPLRGYRVRIRMEANRGQSERVLRVSIAVDGTTVTLTTATAGATIYYTTDGTSPGPSNSAAQIYSAPFTAADGAEVRAAGFKTGLIQSGIASKTV